MKKNVSSAKGTVLDFDRSFLPHIAIDTVIFGYHEGRMMVLLLQYKNSKANALPGGFIYKDEAIDEAARRILQDRTGVSDIYLEQFHTFGANNRQDDSMLAIMKGRGMKPVKDHFLLRRFISISYYALVDYTKVIPAKDGLSDDCKWVDLKRIPALMQDHLQIIEVALEHLRNELDRKLVVFNLMPSTFTMKDLQGLYETVRGEKMRRTSFQRKILNLGIVKVVEKKMTGAAHKAPYVYTFKRKKSAKS